MEKIIYQLDRIATALETIARRLPQSPVEFTSEPANDNIELSSISPNAINAKRDTIKRQKIFLLI